ncbi:hypothetical protein [Helicobacter suis]|uniref:hypothetical protein n=1 Tax=Helicobacter suis TaxID=104628 RepID=UPI0013D4422E|nr:hypothetical protein [Helicobacter suis]
MLKTFELTWLVLIVRDFTEFKRIFLQVLYNRTVKPASLAKRIKTTTKGLCYKRRE